MIVAGIDIETTGLSQPDGHRIVEFAALLYDLETGQKLGQYVQRINPQRPIDPAAQAVHHISFEDVAYSPIWDEVAPKVSKLLAKCDVLVAHNGEGFDLPFITNELMRVGQVTPSAQLVDTMLQGRWATPNGKYPNLGELCFACDVSYDTSKAHGAEYDVDVMMQSFFKAFREGFFSFSKPVIDA